MASLLHTVQAATHRVARRAGPKESNMQNLRETAVKFNEWLGQQDNRNARTNGGACVYVRPVVEGASLHEDYDGELKPNCIIGTFLSDVFAVDLKRFLLVNGYGIGNFDVEENLGVEFSKYAKRYLNVIQAVADNDGAGNVPWNVAASHGTARFQAEWGTIHDHGDL